MVSQQPVATALPIRGVLIAIHTTARIRLPNANGFLARMVSSDPTTDALARGAAYVPRRRRRTARPPRASRRVAATSAPVRDSAGAGSDTSVEHSPAWPGLSQDCPGGQEG